MIFDVVVFIFGIIEVTDSSCYAGIGNIISSCLHFALRFCFFQILCCLVGQVQFAENPICKPILWVISCGCIDHDKAREVRARLKSDRGAADEEAAAAGSIPVEGTSNPGA